MIREKLIAHGLTTSRLAWSTFKGTVAAWFLIPHLPLDVRRSFVLSGDPVRFGTVFLALERLLKEGIQGSLAECGVYQGTMSQFLLKHCPGRKLFLFDTFEGFDPRDSDTRGDNRFRDTSVESVLRRLEWDPNVVVKKGFFPETALGLEHERFAFIMVDFDKLEPTREALEFFYPRVVSGGYVFVHDYNSTESNGACAKALDSFLADKPEKVMTIPDAWGSALFRKL